MAISNNLNSFYKAGSLNSTDLLSVIDIEGNYSFVGDSVNRQLGYSPEELIGTNAFEYIHPDDTQKASFSLSQIVGQSEVKAPLFRFRAKDGTYHWIECTVTNKLDDPEIRGLVTNSKDVTDLIELDAQRKLNHTYYYSLFLNHPDALFFLNSDGVIYNSNLSFTSITGYNEYELGETKLINLVYPEYQKATLDAFTNSINGTVATIEVKAYNRSNEGLYLLLTFIPVFFERNVKEIQCVAKDITTKHLQQLELQKLSLVASKITNGVILADADENIEWVNSGFTKLTGFTADDLSASSLGKFLVGNENKNVSSDIVSQYFRKNTAAPLEVLTYKKNGDEIWFLVEITPVKNGFGNVCSFISILTDITERKTAEMETLMLTKDLFDRNKELQELEEVLKRDLKAPLQQVQALLSKIASSKEASHYNQALNKIIRTINSLTGKAEDSSSFETTN